jgi:phosphate acyltransferase
LQRDTEKAAVKRLCRDADALLSRPGRGAALRFADRRYPWRFSVRGRAHQTARDQVSGTFMPQKVRIALDVMGGDVGASVVIPGAAISLTRHPDSEFLLFGDRAKIDAELAKHPALQAASQVFHTDVAVSSHDKPSQALRRGRKTSSMWLAIDAVKKGDADVVVSAGNTGALMAMARFCLRTLPGIDRPAIAAVWPTMRGDSVVLDLGATIGGDAHHLMALAVMGSAMASVLFDLERPTVGLLNIGVEEIKGREEIREAAELLRAMNLPQLEYIGFVEGDGIGKGAADVIVAEGFSGNIALKATEGTARQINEFLRAALSRTWRSRIGYLFARNAFKALRDKLDPNKSNGGVMLGLNGIVVKSHGGTDAEGFAYAVDVGYEMVRYDLLTKINRMLNPDGSALASAPTAQEAVS